MTVLLYSPWRIGLAPAAAFSMPDNDPDTPAVMASLRSLEAEGWRYEIEPDESEVKA